MMRLFAQRCRACRRKWLCFTTSPEPDSRCWFCGSDDLEPVGTAETRELPPPDEAN